MSLACLPCVRWVLLCSAFLMGLSAEAQAESDSPLATQPNNTSAAKAGAKPLPPPGEKLASSFSRLNVEGAAFLSLCLPELAVPGEGTVNPLGISGALAVRYLPGDFPFHAYFEVAGGHIVSGTSTGPSGTFYDNRMSSYWFGPGVGFDLGGLRATAGLGLALTLTSHKSSESKESLSSLALGSQFGLAYLFSSKDTHALSVDFRYLRVAGAKIDAFMLGLRFHLHALKY